jgi:hypothetical protein
MICPDCGSYIPFGGHACSYQHIEYIGLATAYTPINIICEGRSESK